MQFALSFDAEKSSKGGGGGYNRREIKKKGDGFSDSSVMHPGHFANINGFIFFTLLKLSGSKTVYDYSTTRRKSGRRLSKLYNQRSPIPPPPFPKRTYTSLLTLLQHNGRRVDVRILEFFPRRDSRMFRNDTCEQEEKKERD